MGHQINLLKYLPETSRNVNSRHLAKTPEIIKLSRKFGKAYFDGDRKYGYGGYKYDGRWISVAKDIINTYGLKPGMKVLDIGCAKGFLVKDLMDTLPGLEVFGVDISDYAILNCHKDVVGRLHKASAGNLPFPNDSFEFVISINTLHNLKRDGVIKALKEIQRVGRGNSFIQVDAYTSEEEKELFMQWVLTAEYHDYPDGWRKLFLEAGYSGDYNWTILSS